jgi:small-conductance mechanosensitive channel
MDLASVEQTILLDLDRLERHLLEDVLILPHLIQIPAILLTGGLAWLCCRPIRRWAVACLELTQDERHFGWVLKHRHWLIERVVPLITPSAWAIGLWISVAVARRGGWPYEVTETAVSLLIAWLIIRLAAVAVPNAALARLIAVFAWLVAALNIFHLLDPTLQALDSAAITMGALRISVLTVVKGVISLAMLLWVASIGSELLERRITTLTDFTPRAQVLFGKLIKGTLVTLAVVVSLSSVGVDLWTFAIFTGTVGVGIGLGLQRSVSNLFSGIVLLLDKSIKPGDVIEVGGTYGWVASLGARYVSVETRDGTEFLIPNEDIVTQQVINWSHRNDRVRLKVPVRVPHDSDLDQVLALMLEAAGRPPRVLLSPAPTSLIMAFGESAIELELRFWINDAQNGTHNVKSQVLHEIWRLFQQQGIQIPYPKRDLYVRSNELSANGPCTSTTLRAFGTGRAAAA